MIRSSKQKKSCLACGEKLIHSGYKYCSNDCQQKFQYHEYIKKWKAGKIVGLQRLGVVSRPIKRYLRSKYNNRCSLCGWSRKNPITGEVPLVADHIDGNWRNNKESNLRLVCPNCDSLSSTYAALNKGKGRRERPPSKRRMSAIKLLS